MAAGLMTDICQREGTQPKQIILQSDNSSHTGLSKAGESEMSGCIND
jgi:hypothetical protein